MPHAARRTILIRTAAVAAGLALLIAACGGGGGGGSLSATDPWVRYTGPDVPAGGFMVLENAGDAADALVSASSPDFGSIELHETVEGGDGMMAMQPVASIPVPAGGSTELKPGSYHLMLFEPTGEIEIGQTVEITLAFEQGGTVTVQAEVQAP
jgi:copper(I)-binding protein